MARQNSRRDRPRAVPDGPTDPSQPATASLPARRRGGQELPDDVQDRPEQNAGYDAAAHGQTTSPPREPLDDLGVDAGDDRGMRIDPLPGELPAEERPGQTADERAERDAVAEVRRRERRR